MMKKIILGLLGLVILLTLVGFLLPGKLEVSKSVTVNAPAEYAFEEINGLENWGRWSYWNTLDSGMSITYGEVKSGDGASYSWDSKMMGQGQVSITESTPFSLIKADLNFMENGTAKAWYDFKPEGASTKVSMNFSQDFGMNPFGRWVGTIFVKPELNKAFDFSLQKIKELAEAKPRFSVAITEEDAAEKSYIGLKHTMSPQNTAEVSAQMRKLYGQLYAAAKKAKVEPTGPAFCIFPSYNEESMEMVCALPVPAGATVSKQFPLMQIPAGRVVKAVHKGTFDNLGTTHNDIGRYLDHKNLEMNGAPWEVYVTYPHLEPDTSKWITEVYYPVKGDEI